MNDLISRQAAIDALEEPCKVPDTWTDESAICERMQWEKDVKALKNLPSAQPEQRWIPVSERLPEDLQEVNVTWINRDPASYYAHIKDVPQTGCAVYYGGCWYWYSATCTDTLVEYGENDIDLIANGIEITAWQPLPEPYKGGEE